MNAKEQQDYEHPRKLRKLNDNSAVSSSNSSANKNVDSHLKVFQPELSVSSEDRANNDLDLDDAQIGENGAIIKKEPIDNVLEIQEMQNQMAMMEAMGRQEEFVTSA